MTDLTPDALSPLAQLDVLDEIPYGLTWDQLQNILPGYDRQSNRDPRVYTSHIKQGINGGENSCIRSLCYSDAQGNEHRLPLFFKRCTDPRLAEAQRYRFLEARGVALPRLLAVFQQDGAEVLVLEFLERIGIDFHSASEVTELLRLAARINAIREFPPYFTTHPGMAQETFDTMVCAVMQALEKDTDLAGVDAAHWYAAYQEAQRARQLMPTAMCHGEFYFQQVGWSGQGAERRLVVFDLETMSPRPRFTDLTAVLYELSVFSASPEAELLSIYLAALQEYSPKPLRLAEAEREMRLLRISEACYSLPWLSGQADPSYARILRKQLLMTVACMSIDLKALAL